MQLDPISQRSPAASLEDPASIPGAVYRCFLFTDIEGSTSLWELYGEDFRRALDIHHRTLREVIRTHGGRELVEAGDGFLISFADAEVAARCAAAAQEAFARQEYPGLPEPLRIRMGLHGGEVEPRENGEFRGLVLNRGARVRDTAHGGQIVCSWEVARALDGEFRCRELGRFRLKGIPAPETLYQVEWSGMEEGSFPPPNARPAYFHNLPHYQTKFVGRSREIAAVSALLSEKGAPRLVTLTGPGGTGKTRLGVAIAEQLLARFSHAVFMVPLADLEDAAAIPREIVQALRLDLDGSKKPEEQIADFLRDDPALLVLDNFEHVTQGGAPVLQRLLAGIPQLQLLVTSRNSIDLLGEREYPVAPLKVPEADALLEELRESESVQLYVNRAQLTFAAFELHERNAAAVGALCRRLDGVPLAIELAAARADVVSPQEILQGLSGSLDSLEAADSEAIPARHRTLRAAIDWSFGFLPPALKDFFTALAVFRGGWTGPAAEAVAATPALGGVSANVLRALSELRAASLITTEESGASMRFRMLETLRQYAEERFQVSPDKEAIIGRHRQFFLTLAEEAEAKMSGGEQLFWMERLEAEHDNLRAILNDTYTDETGIRVAGALALFWYVRGHFAEGLRYVDKQLAVPVEAKPINRLNVLNSGGMLALAEGDYDRAKEFFEQALALTREMEDRRNIAGMLNNVGTVAMKRKEYSAAEPYFQEANAIYLELGNREQTRARVLVNLSSVYLGLNDPSRAKECAEQARRILEVVQDQNSLISAFTTLGRVAIREGDLASARDLLEKALTLSLSCSAPNELALALSNRAEMEMKEGNCEAAARDVAAAVYISEQYGIRNWADETTTKLISSLRERFPSEVFDQLWQRGESFGGEYVKRFRRAGKS